MRSTDYGNLYTITAQKTCCVNALVSKGPRYWKSSPIQVKSAAYLGTIKTRVKNHLTM